MKRKLSIRRTRSVRGLLVIAGLLAASTTTKPARAGGPLGDNGEPITSSDFGIDIYRGTVLGGSRTTGLGGAYSAIAEGVDGNLLNPATPAVRPFYSVSYFDYWLGLGLTLPALSELDYFNTGERDKSSRAPSSFLFLSPAMNLQWGNFGVGLTVELQRYSSGTTVAAASNLDTRIITTHLQFANSFFDGQAVAGLGTRAITLALTDKACENNQTTARCAAALLNEQKPTFTSTGAGAEFGLLLRPNDQPFRIGASFRTAINTEASFTDELLPNADGDLVIAGEEEAVFYFPRRVHLPWDVNLGFAFQFGRPFNPRWRPPRELAKKRELELELEAIELEEQQQKELQAAKTPVERQQIEEKYERLLESNRAKIDREREDAWWTMQQELADWDRFYVLLTASLIISGSVPSAVGVESYFNQVVRRSGTVTTYAPHFGLETEAVPDILKLRAGGYVEPGRSHESSPRGHVTFGGDIRLARFDVFGLWPADYLWALGVFADIAPRYVTWGVSLIGWYPRQRGTVRRDW